MSRLRVLANGWLREVRRSAYKLAVVDRRFAAIAAFQNHASIGLVAPQFDALHIR
jgi:hypothetical protein